ncbi:chromosomal replication initiator protein DnaA [Patescibacteria group bacterium]|nr:MAG: chromosomal replication initiator protein DnaA [Patescibacteria group bacterium]
MSAIQLWQAALGELELSISKANFTTWFKNTFVSSFENGRVVISVPNAFTKLYIEKRYHSVIQKSLQNALNAPVREILYSVDSRLPAPEPPPTRESLAPVQAAPNWKAAAVAESGTLSGTNEFGLRQSYTFENFIVGKGSELAHAAALAVTEHPGVKYNPFFIHGGVGLGKTHLLQAVGNRLLERNPELKALCVTCEQFTNDFISALRSGHTKEFRDRYRSVDLLLVDDIQFITGKEGTQEEFFHTFNALYQAGKQVVITSDRPPKSIGTLEERLRSRFEMGLIADISAPDLETRIAILTSKCQEHGWSMLSRDVLAMIADTVQTNVRELEGALNKIIAHHEFYNLQPTVESVREVLATFSQNQAKKSITPKQLIHTVAGYFDLNIDDLLGKSREKKLAFPRQITMYLMRTELKSSFPTIGDELGGRDHTTAIHACEKISKVLENDERLRLDMEAIKERLYTGI